MKKIVLFIAIAGLLGLEYGNATKPAGCIDSSSYGHPNVGAPCICNDQIVFRQTCDHN